MEVFLPRAEIRRRIQARLGHTTNGSQAPLVMEQMNEWIRAGATAVYKRCQWAQTAVESREDAGIDQRFVNYPANTGPGNVISVAVWMEDEQRFIPLQRGRIPVELDDEPLVELGEPDSVSGRGCPTMYELKKQIEIWPRPDIAYRLKIDHTTSPELADETTPSIVDAEAIILHVLAEAYDFQGDERLASVKRAQFDDHVKQLANDQHPLTTIRRGAYDRLSVGPRRTGDYIPDSGAWPSRMET